MGLIYMLPLLYTVRMTKRQNVTLSHERGMSERQREREREKEIEISLKYL
jgi:hypothetical protein